MSAAIRPLPRGAEAAARAAIFEYQSDTAELIAERVPLSSRITLHVIALMVVTAVALAFVVPVDRVVKARGRVVATAPTMIVQPLELSVVRKIAVSEGDVVRKGQLLAALDATFSAADYVRLREERRSLEAEVARLSAELDGTFYGPAAGDRWQGVQTALYTARAAEHAAALLRYDEKIAAIGQSIAKTETELSFYRERLKLFSEVEGMRTKLEKKQVGSRLQSLVATDSRLEMERNVADAEGTIVTARHEMESLKAERQVYVTGRTAQIARELADKHVALDRAREEASKAERRRELVELRAPGDAVVLQVASFSVGSIVQPAERLISLMPADTRLQIEAELPADDQGSVKVGDEVVVKLDAWPFVEHGAAKGVVHSISADSFTPKDGGGRTFYIAKIDIVQTRLHGVPEDFRLIPGMPLTADIAVGTRTLMEYVAGGTFRTFEEGLSEP